MVDSTWFKEQLKIFQESWETKGQSKARLIELEHPAPTPTGYEDANIHWAPNFFRRTLFKDYRFISVTKPKVCLAYFFVLCAGSFRQIFVPRLTVLLLVCHIVSKSCSSDSVRWRSVVAGGTQQSAKSDQRVHVCNTYSCVLEAGCGRRYGSSIFNREQRFQKVMLQLALVPVNKTQHSVKQSSNVLCCPCN